MSAIAVTAFVVGFSGAMMPGPLLTVTIGESARRGFSAGPLIVFGHGLLELALVVALVGGFSTVLTLPEVGRGIALLGGGFLLYLGYGMVKDAWQGKVSLALSIPAGSNGEGSLSSGRPRSLTDSGRRPGWYLIGAGILISLANPYWIIWWATIGLGYLNFSLQSGLAGLAAFFIGHISADATWYCLVAAAVSGGRRFLNDRSYRGILVGCGFFLIGLGFYFLSAGI